jgi:hypothetical protein
LTHPSVEKSVLQSINNVRFQVLKAVNIKMNVFWVAAPCSQEDVYRVAEVPAAFIIRAIALAIEAAGTFEYAVDFIRLHSANSLRDGHLYK